VVFHNRPDSKIETLRAVPVFADLGRRELEHIAQITELIESEPGKVLVREGELGRELVVIAEGSARVQRKGVDIARLQSGEAFGEIALLDGKPRSATVVTETSSVLLIVEKRSFDSLLETVPGLQRQMLLALCARLRRREESSAD
jgi:CRP/FNR family transcriptional regulator, cyclic AMP receptor protein